MNARGLLILLKISNRQHGFTSLASHRTLPRTTRNLASPARLPRKTSLVDDISDCANTRQSHLAVDASRNVNRTDTNSSNSLARVEAANGTAAGILDFMILRWDG